MLKEKVSISEEMKLNFDTYIANQINLCQNLNQKFSIIDGIKIYYSCGSWSHIRISNTEPIIRLIVESDDHNKAHQIKKELINSINNYLK